jgi:DNA-binding transcriptional MerR regulator
MTSTELAIQEVARLAGTTSRTLRHYDQVGLLTPSRIGENGYRYYDRDALVRLQRILLLRELGLGIPAIRGVLDGQTDDAQALASHLRWLEQEKSRLDRQIASVEGTIRKLKGKEQLMADEMFDGFDHTEYRDEVTERWGGNAYTTSDAWWRSKSPEQQRAYQEAHIRIAADYAGARDAGQSPESPVVQEVAGRHVEWLRESSDVTPERLRGLGELYVADPRFAKNYGGQAGAEFVRDALAHYAAASLG